MYIEGEKKGSHLFFFFFLIIVKTEDKLRTLSIKSTPAWILGFNLFSFFFFVPVLLFLLKRTDIRSCQTSYHNNASTFLSMQACPTPFYGMEFLHNTRKSKNFMSRKTLKSNRKGKISTPTCSANFLLWLSTYLC